MTEGRTRAPEPTLSALLGWSLTVWLLLLAPFLLLLQIDALLVYRTPAQLGRDAALMLVACALPAAAMALTGGLTAAVARKLTAGDAADCAAWLAVMLPTMALALWQMARALGIVLKRGTEFHVSWGPNLRALAALAILSVTLLALRHWGTRRLVERLFAVAWPLRGFATAALLAAVAAVVLAPQPIFRSSPAPAKTLANNGAPRPDVFLITLDALAAADAGVCGTGPTTMPHLRAFASGASCFERHYSSGNYTNPTTSTVETGLLPWTHWAAQIGAQVHPRFLDHTLSGALRRVGYRTHSATANYLASPRHHGTYGGYDTEQLAPSTSLASGFEALLSIFADSALPQTLLPLLPPEIDYLHLRDKSPTDPAATYALILQQLARHDPAPQFVWAHTLPPHAPYLPPASTKYRLLPPGELENYRDFRTGNMPYPASEQPLVDKHRLRYRETIMGADEALGAFLDELKRLGRLDNALVIISADHGESFEGGFIGHAGPLLTDVLVRVPLVIKQPGQRQGRRIDTPVSQADIAATVLDLVGAAPLPHSEGHSLRHLLDGRSSTHGPVFTMSLESQSRFRPIERGHFAVIDGELKAELDLAGNHLRLHDVVSDPEQRIDLAAKRPDDVRRLGTLLRERIAAAEARRPR